jgi:hypothetical protein
MYNNEKLFTIIQTFAIQILKEQPQKYLPAVKLWEKIRNITYRHYNYKPWEQPTKFSIEVNNTYRNVMKHLGKQNRVYRLDNPNDTRNKIYILIN